jgi:hypothetical protein
MRNLSSAFLILCLFVPVFVGCAPDAPHDNPHDPGSPNRIMDGNLSGKVLTLGFPYAGISGALVAIEGTNLVELTAADGSFNFSNAPSGNVVVVITKSSYLSDTIRVSLAAGGSLDTLIKMDALPVVSSAQVVTSKFDHWYPGPVYTALVSANVNDPDGSSDLSDVYVTIDSITFGMNYNIESGNFQATIFADSLPNQDLQWLVGKQFNVFAVDRENGIGQPPGFFVTRIIESEAKPTSPTGSDTTTSKPIFNWNLPGVSFAYTYQLLVMSLAGGTPTQVWSQTIPNSSTYEFSYPDSLRTGTYYWTISIIDQFGNSSCSKEAAFIVQAQ